MELQANQASQWRIVREPQAEDAPARFSVLRNDRRVVWGLRDQDAAARWVRRLSLPTQAQLGFETPR
jgi:hypothetical protein